MLGEDRHTVSTPGVKEKVTAPRGQCRPAEEEEVGTFEARTSVRTAKVRELQQQVRDLAARLAAAAAPPLAAVAAPARHGSQEEAGADRVLTEEEEAG